jgi:hypothetical protein
VPTGSTTTGFVDVYGLLEFAGAFTSNQHLYVRAGGTARALGTGATDFVSFLTSMHLLSAGATLDNSVATATPTIGFRRKTSYSEAAGSTRLGPVPPVF